MHPDNYETDIEDEVTDGDGNFVMNEDGSIKELDLEKEVPSHCPLLKSDITLSFNKRG
jgi:hypothetical protein